MLESTISPLIKAAEICIVQEESEEVCLNIVRTLSVLSERSDCCEYLSDASSRLGIILGSVIQMNPLLKGLAISNRLGYILGNIMAR